MALPDLIEKFSAAGGSFVASIEELQQKFGQCRAVVFDWDGVFNAGRKSHTASSGFAEADSMGTNMLRYGLWRKLGEMPYTAIISGEHNEDAIAFAEREHLTAVFTGIRGKQHAIAHLCDESGLQTQQIACVFDDINDLAMAEVCGLRLLVRRRASPMFADYVERRKLCDYITGADATGHAVREVCELMLGLMDSYDAVIDSRVASDAEYETYLSARQAVTPEIVVGPL